MRVILPILLVISLASVAGAQTKRRAVLTRAQVKEAEQRLSDLGYWTGPVDGLFDEASRTDLIAFQKWEGRTINGKLTLK